MGLKEKIKWPKQKEARPSAVPEVLAESHIGEDRLVFDLTRSKGKAEGPFEAKKADLSIVSTALASDPKGFYSSQLYRRIEAACMGSSIALEDLLSVFDAFISGANTAGKETSRNACRLAATFCCHVSAQRPERDQLIDSLAPRIGSWSGLMMGLLVDSDDSSPRKKAFFDIVARSVEPKELMRLLDARNPEIADWAVERLNSARRTQLENRMPRKEYPKPIFDPRHHTDLQGNTLHPNSTRYLDDAELFAPGEGAEKAINRIADELSIRPRDLEIMVFYAFSGFDFKLAADPHLYPEGDQVKADAEFMMMGNDVEQKERVLNCSYAVYLLHFTSPGAESAEKILGFLWKEANQMGARTDYSNKFYDETVRLMKKHGLWKDVN
jgi:hypothetical protein